MSERTNHLYTWMKDDVMVGVGGVTRWGKNSNGKLWWYV